MREWYSTIGSAIRGGRRSLLRGSLSGALTHPGRFKEAVDQDLNRERAERHSPPPVPSLVCVINRAALPCSIVRASHCLCHARVRAGDGDYTDWQGTAAVVVGRQ